MNNAQYTQSLFTYLFPQPRQSIGNLDRPSTCTCWPCFYWTWADLEWWMLTLLLLNLSGSRVVNLDKNTQMHP